MKNKNGHNNAMEPIPVGVTIHAGAEIAPLIYAANL
jgi:hypothetical protein